jgi:hypothetical protein
MRLALGMNMMDDVGRSGRIVCAAKHEKLWTIVFGGGWVGGVQERWGT